MYIRFIAVLFGCACMTVGCQTQDPICMEWQRRKELLIELKGLHPINGVPERVAWIMPNRIVVDGECLLVVKEGRRYNLISEDGELRKRVSIFFHNESNHAMLVERTAWAVANPSSAPLYDDTYIRGVEVRHEGNYIIFPRGGLSAEIMYSNVAVRVYFDYKDSTKEFNPVELAKAILEAGLKKAEEEE